MESGDKASNQNCSPLLGWFQFASGFFKTGPSFSSPISHNLTINIFFFPLTNHYLPFQTIKLWQREFLPKLLVENGLSRKRTGSLLFFRGKTYSTYYRSWLPGCHDGDGEAKTTSASRATGLERAA